MIHVGDGTWNLRVFITDLQVDKTLRVKGDLHIGGVMLKLVDPGWLLKPYSCIYSNSQFVWLISVTQCAKYILTDCVCLVLSMIA